MSAPSEDYDRQVDELAAGYGHAGALMAAATPAAVAASSPAGIAATRSAVETILEALLAASAIWIYTNVPLIYLRGLEDGIRESSSASGVDEDEARRGAAEAMRKVEHRQAVEVTLRRAKEDLSGAAEGMARDMSRAIAGDPAPQRKGSSGKGLSNGPDGPVHR